MPVRPISVDALTDLLVEMIVAEPGRRRVAIDGADAVRPGDLADRLVAPIRVQGRPVIRVNSDDHLRPASLRFERGRADPDSFYEDWLDEDGLRREVLDPLGPDASGAPGTGQIRPARWNAALDRARRDPYISAPVDVVLLVSGPLLLGRGLPFDLAVHLAASPAALRRRTDPALAWTLPAYDRYADEVAPADWADVVVRLEDPRHPALVRVPARRA